MKVKTIQFTGVGPVRQYEEEYEGVTYYLTPDSHIKLRNLYENSRRYNELYKASQDNFKRPEVLQDCELTRNHQTRLKGVLPKDLCKIFIREGSNSLATIYHPKFMDKLLPMILTEEIDSYICSYFNSEYMLYWYTFLESEADMEKRIVSTYWHCDGGPEKHLKMLIYLNAYEEHGGNTKFLDLHSSTQLKNAGYIFNNVSDRVEDLGPLCRAKGIEPVETMYEDIEAGDALLFNPNQLAHIGVVPDKASRYVLQLCFIPSPYPYQFTREEIWMPKNDSISFDDGPPALLDYYNRNPQEMANRVLIPSTGEIRSPAYLKLLLHNMYSNEHFADLMFERLIELDPDLVELNSIESLMETLKNSYQHSINWQGELGSENIVNLLRLAEYEEEVQDAISRYSTKNKPKPEGIFWPSPDHPTKPASKFDALPFVKKYPIMDMSTPIGSAGSCFAFEIARVFQEQGYNYVVTERNDDPGSKIIVDGYTPGDKYAKFCANYGILFNTPSFRQMAERAFDVKRTKQLLFEQEDGTWMDPYRENVLFLSKDAYFEDYNKHIEATRMALEQTEVFIITLGLNECWQFRDGSVMSRNPRSYMYPLVRHKTLTVQENIDNIQTFYDICKAHNPKFKLIISVSPIPFLATGRADTHHVISANTHSKAVLRVAAEELVNNNEDVYYLPSYELVTECIKDAWDTDERHVKTSTVEQVVNMFKEIFIK